MKQILILALGAVLFLALSTPVSTACDDCPEHPTVARGWGCDGFYHDPSYTPPPPPPPAPTFVPTVMILGHIIWPQSSTTWLGGLWGPGRG